MKKTLLLLITIFSGVVAYGQLLTGPSLSVADLEAALSNPVLIC